MTPFQCFILMLIYAAAGWYHGYFTGRDAGIKISTERDAKGTRQIKERV